MRNYSAKDVDSYIASAEPAARPVMEEIRKIIKTTVPTVEEGISWGVPFYKYHGVLGGFSVFTGHVSFGFADLLQTDIRKALEEKGYETGKKIIQIKFDQKVPVAEIRQIVKNKSATNEIKTTK